MLSAEFTVPGSQPPPLSGWQNPSPGRATAFSWSSAKFLVTFLAFTGFSVVLIPPIAHKICCMWPLHSTLSSLHQDWAVFLTPQLPGNTHTEQCVNGQVVLQTRSMNVPLIKYLLCTCTGTNRGTSTSLGAFPDN